MKAEKLIREWRTMLGADERERTRRRDELVTLLRMMKSKEKHLIAKAVAEADAGARDHLQREIDMLHAQRRKGLELLRASSD